MKITEQLERQCCAQRDLRPIEGSPKRGRMAEWVFCVHCGHHRRYDSFVDAAGATDWNYRPVMAPWEEF